MTSKTVTVILEGNISRGANQQLGMEKHKLQIVAQR